MEAKLQQQVSQQNHVNKPNLTGIPTQIKLDFERRSGLSFDDVRVHYNSDKPARLQALAYTQGTQVYVGPGQERHLKHELGHVVQQKQGRVKADGLINNMPINMELSLEHEADTYPMHTFTEAQRSYFSGGTPPIQCRLHFDWDSNRFPKWQTTGGERPNWSTEVERTLKIDNQYIPHEEEQSRNHIISYNTIHNILSGVLTHKLNADNFVPDESYRTMGHHVYDSNNFLEFTLRQLVALIMPKSNDYVYTHHIESAINTYKEILENISLIKQSLQNEEETNPNRTNLENELEERIESSTLYEDNIKKFLDNADKQRAVCKELVSQILTCFDYYNGSSGTVSASSVPRIDVIKLDAYTNELESYLYNSMGNLRIGYKSTNSGIGVHIDPVSAPLAAPSAADGSSYIDFTNANEEIIKEETVGNKTVKFQSPEYAMRKRMTYLHRIGRHSQNSFKIPGFLCVRDPSTEELSVISSDQPKNYERQNATPVKILIKPVLSKYKPLPDETYDTTLFAASYNPTSRKDFLLTICGSEEEVDDLIKPEEQTDPETAPISTAPNPKRTRSPDFEGTFEEDS